MTIEEGRHRKEYPFRCTCFSVILNSSFHDYGLRALDSLHIYVAVLTWQQVTRSIDARMIHLFSKLAVFFVVSIVDFRSGWG
jgi:hypothetical protein